MQLLKVREPYTLTLSQDPAANPCPCFWLCSEVGEFHTGSSLLNCGFLEQDQTSRIHFSSFPGETTWKGRQAEAPSCVTEPGGVYIPGLHTGRTKLWNLILAQLDFGTLKILLL